MDVEPVVGAVADVDEAVHVVAPIGNGPLLLVGAVAVGEAGLRLAVGLVLLVEADAELLLGARHRGADEVARPVVLVVVGVRGRGRHAVELPQVAILGPHDDVTARRVEDLEAGLEGAARVFVHAGFRDLVPDVWVNLRGRRERDGLRVTGRHAGWADCSYAGWNGGQWRPRSKKGG